MTLEVGRSCVFVVSADADLRVLCRGALPFPIAVTRPGEDALRSIARTRPGVVLIEIVEATDWQVVGRLRTSPFTARVPVIALAASHLVDGPFRRCARQLGCSAVLVKPCDPDTLLEAVEEALTVRSRGRLEAPRNQS